MKPLEFYKGARRHSNDATRMGWSSRKNQHENFMGLLALCETKFPLEGASIHDAGCGYGALIPYLRPYNTGTYLGTDFMDDALAKARADHPGKWFAKLDLLKDPLPKADVTLLVGTLAFHQPDDALKIIKKAWDASALGVAFLLWWSVDSGYVMHKEAEKAKKLVARFIKDNGIDHAAVFPAKKGEDALFVLAK